jgi:hypothetical protein
MWKQRQREQIVKVYESQQTILSGERVKNHTSVYHIKRLGVEAGFPEYECR